jgi:hypothetical protein
MSADEKASDSTVRCESIVALFMYPISALNAQLGLFELYSSTHPSSHYSARCTPVMRHMSGVGGDYTQAV